MNMLTWVYCKSHAKENISSSYLLMCIIPPDRGSKYTEILGELFAPYEKESSSFESRKANNQQM